MTSKPEFPITVSYADDEDVVFDNPIEAAVTLEWFDSDDPEEGAAVTDSRGRKVRLKVEKLEIVTCELVA